MFRPPVHTSAASDSRMPGFPMDALHRNGVVGDSNGDDTPIFRSNDSDIKSSRSKISSRTPPSDSFEFSVGGIHGFSIEQLYRNVCDIQSSNPSPSRASFLSFGEESRIDSELCHLAGDIGELDIDVEHVAVPTSNKNYSSAVANSTPDEIQRKSHQVFTKQDKKRSKSIKKQLFKLQSECVGNERSSPRNKLLSPKKPNGLTKNIKKDPISERRVKDLGAHQEKSIRRAAHHNESGLDNPDLGPFLLKQTRNMIASGEHPQRVLELATRAVKSFELCANGRPNLEYVMSLHVLAAIYCSLGQYSDAIPVLESSIEIPAMEHGENHALAKFAGCMQLGDTYLILGLVENSLLYYSAGLEIQRQVLGERDPRFGETCRHIAEAHVQALQLDAAEKFCEAALQIHCEKGSHATREEAMDRRLMGLICEAKGNPEAALEHYVLASLAVSVDGQVTDLGPIDRSIGDAYLALTRYDEALFAYEKALTRFKSTNGESSISVASVYVRLADLYNTMGKLKETRSYCKIALRIYEKPNPVAPQEEIANGLVDISAIYQSMKDLNRAISLLRKAQRIYEEAPGRQRLLAGIESQIGVLYYMMGKFEESYNTFHSAISKFRVNGMDRSALLGLTLNQMGLSCVQRYAIHEAAEVFEEARSILEEEYGLCHPNTLGVCSNLAGTYDAMGRLDEAIEILDCVVALREEKLGTGDPNADDEKRRLDELLKDTGRKRNKKSISLISLLPSPNPRTKKQFEVLS